MRFREFEQPLEEGGKSGGKRYNSEIGMLVGFLGIDPTTFDPKFPEHTLQGQPLENYANTIRDIKKFLPPNWDKELFAHWATLGNSYLPLIQQELNTLKSKPITVFSWAGGTNKSDMGPSDIGFPGTITSGISIKAEGGITLGNLTPKTLGLTPDRGQDVFHKYAQADYEQMKIDIFNTVMNLADKTPNQPLTPLNRLEYSITANTNTQGQIIDYTCKGKSTFKGTRQDVLNASSKNAKWQRVFGNWFQENWQQQKHLAANMFTSLGTAFQTTIQNTLSTNSGLPNLLRFADQPYFYASHTGLYLVPDIQSAQNLQLASVRYAAPDGTSQLFKVGISQPGSTNQAELDVYVRYANGMFEANPTVRVQSLNNPQFIGWKKLV